MATLPHILLAIVGATLAGAIWAGIAGFLKATVGAHEVISTIMLNWIAIWVGTYLFGAGGPLQNSTNKSLPISNDIADTAKLPVFWGDQDLQGLHIGFFVALAALVVFWLVLNRTTLGYEVRAVGFNPEAAAYGGISVKKNLIRAMAISGAFAGLAGGARHARLPLPLRRLDIPVSARSASSASRSRCSAATPRSGVGLGAFLFGGLLFGTTHGLHLERDPARARRQPDLHHPGADRALRRRRRAHPLRLEHAPEAAPAQAGDDASDGARVRRRTAVWRALRGPDGDRDRRHRCSASFARFLADPADRGPLDRLADPRRHRRRRVRHLDGDARPRRLGWGAVAAGLIGIGLGILATRSSSRQPERRLPAPT